MSEASDVTAAEVGPYAGVRLRRVALAGALLVSAAAGAFVASAPLAAREPVEMPVSGEPPAVWFAGQVDEAWQQLRETGSVDVAGFVPPLRVASDQVATVVVAALADDGVCYFGGVIDGGAAQVRVDPSGSACGDELFAELTATLAPRPHAGTPSQAPGPVAAELSRLAGDAARFASLALSGRVSLAGYSVPFPAVSHVSADGSSVQIDVDGWCATVHVADLAAPPAPVRCR
jgi:hypothetical protein